MDLVIDMELPRPPADVVAFVNDLSDYPRWMGLVHAATPQPNENESAWSVELRAKVGPFARSKRLRMVRTVDESPNHVRFERKESDTSSHGKWILDARLDGTTTTRLTVRLQYEGRLWSSVVERVLRDEVERSKERLAALVSAR
jgi:carbon monoxide dehydrogenase subunit G